MLENDVGDQGETLPDGAVVAMIAARVRAIFDCARTQRTSLRGPFAGIKPKLSAPDFAWSICKTVEMRQNLWPARCNVGFTKAIPT
jgi:hypothetical protein